MLSAVVQLLYEIQNETNRERKRAIIDLATAAYPDLRPWQAKKACDVSRKNTQASEATREEMKNLYYSYLSLLLDPTDGHDAARRDPALVKVRFQSSVVILSRFRTSFIHAQCYCHCLFHRSGASFL